MIRGHIRDASEDVSSSDPTHQDKASEASSHVFSCQKQLLKHSADKKGHLQKSSTEHLWNSINPEAEAAQSPARQRRRAADLFCVEFIKSVCHHQRRPRSSEWFHYLQQEVKQSQFAPLVVMNRGAAGVRLGADVPVPAPLLQGALVLGPGQPHRGPACSKAFWVERGVPGRHGAGLALWTGRTQRQVSAAQRWTNICSDTWWMQMKQLRGKKTHSLRLMGLTLG